MGRVRWRWSSPVRRWRVWSELCFRTQRGELQLWPKSNRFLNKKTLRTFCCIIMFLFFPCWQVRLYASEFNWNNFVLFQMFCLFCSDISHEFVWGKKNLKEWKNLFPKVFLVKYLNSSTVFMICSNKHAFFLMLTEISGLLDGGTIYCQQPHYRRDQSAVNSWEYKEMQQKGRKEGKSKMGAWVVQEAGHLKEGRRIN